DHGHAAGVAGDPDHVVAGRALDGDRVGRPVTGPRPVGQVEVDFLDGSAGQVVDGDVVDPALGGEVDPLEAVEVHRDAGHVAGEQHPAAVGGDVDLLGDVGAVELQRVGAGLALDDVGAVARVPDERVVARAHERRVVAPAADDQVVPLA